MATANERLMQWLHDAQAMERQARAMLKALARHIENYPEVKAEAKRLLAETEEQASVVQDTLERRGEDMSTLRDLEGQPRASEHCLSGAFVGNESVKRAMTEISGYNILIAAAGAAGDSEMRAVCDEILRQEEAMAEWLRKYLASATVEYLGRKETPPDALAKH
jgi:ferritin-like metal-binding protein YciE